VAEPVACVKKAADSGSSPAAVGVATKVGDVDDELLASVDRPARGDDELLAVAPERRRAAVDRHRADGLTAEVEVEARERLRGLRDDRDRAVDRLRRRAGGVA
jgi:hypothetical protein